ncbi:hypothetical protein [Candidatus Clostridium radicumherbarum]|uniref:Uncharacterized protein n=1 Tax=Candidatus Clostridium radicumherbarum TaxID=3381662 RepID=A0ABW8TN83_9CLOT
MDINKAIRKQKKSNIGFLLFLSFIFFMLPFILFLAHKSNTFFIIYLLIIEMLILITILINISNNYIKYSSDSYRLKIKLLYFGAEMNIICDKVKFVHAEGKCAQMSIIFIMNSRFRNKKIMPIDNNFISKHPYLAQQYYWLKTHNPEDNFYYLIINKGGFEKYKLLDMIYRNCVKAEYTEGAVEIIKEYRGSNIV